MTAILHVIARDVRVPTRLPGPVSGNCDVMSENEGAEGITPVPTPSQGQESDPPPPPAREPQEDPDTEGQEGITPVPTPEQGQESDPPPPPVP